MSNQSSEQLVVAVSSRALFDLETEHKIFEDQGIEAYRDYQIKHLQTPLNPGVAFPFVRRLLSLNEYFPKEEEPFRVIVLSRNSPESGQRFFNSCKHYRLPIRGGAFTSGQPTFPYMKAYGASLFLSANSKSVIEATQMGYPAGLVLPSQAKDDLNDKGLRIAFDFDGVVIDDDSEKQYKQSGLEGVQDYESRHVHSPHNAGPLTELFKKLAYFQKLDMQRRGQQDPYYQPVIRISIVTSRGAPSEERLITTLKSWGMNAAELFLMDGMPKQFVLEQLKPHIFFDDQIQHLQSAAHAVPSVLIPFGVTKESSVRKLMESQEG